MKQHLFFLATFVMWATCTYSQAERILALTLPKSGSHLLAKCIHQLTGKRFFVSTTLKIDIEQLVAQDQFFYAHLGYTSERLKDIRKKKLTTFFMYRDPRDMVVSLVFYLQTAPWAKDKIHHAFNKSLSNIPFNDLLMDFITKGTVYNHLINYGVTNIRNIESFYKAYLPWAQVNDICVIKFEDLVGPQGGGDTQKQLLTIQTIARHLDIELSNDSLITHAASLFGSPAAFCTEIVHSMEIDAKNAIEHFREGQIGSWKKHFTPDHKEAFKRVAGQLLINLGYEATLDW
jgi:hypothetical protein